MSAPTIPRKRVALVIGAGSVKCAAALGLWKVLKREGIAVDMVVGCSGGSLYAAAMALGYDAEETEAMTRRSARVADTRDGCDRRRPWSSRATRRARRRRNSCLRSRRY